MVPHCIDTKPHFVDHNSGFNHVKLKEELVKREEKKFKSRNKITFIYLGELLKNCYVFLKTFLIRIHNQNSHRKKIGSSFTMIHDYILSFHFSKPVKPDLRKHSWRKFFFFFVNHSTRKLLGRYIHIEREREREGKRGLGFVDFFSLCHGFCSWIDI